MAREVGLALANLVKTDLTEDRVQSVLQRFTFPVLTGRMDGAHLPFIYGVNDETSQKFFERPLTSCSWEADDKKCISRPTALVCAKVARLKDGSCSKKDWIGLQDRQGIPSCYAARMRNSCSMFGVGVGVPPS